MLKTYDGVHNIHLNDEARTIGSGRRRVRVRIDAKGVHLRCQTTRAYKTLGKREFAELAQCRNNAAEFAHLFND